METQDFNYVVIKCVKTIALFVSADDAIKFAETKKDNYTWLEVRNLKTNELIYYWIY